MEKTPALHDVYLAHARIRPITVRTGLVNSPGLVESSGARSVHLKLECLQNTGSFKIRGAANKIMTLSSEEKERGVITFSTGNHGRAVAFVARQCGIHAVVCLSEHVASCRAEAARSLGAEVCIKGHSQDEAEEHYCQLTASRGLAPVVPFDDPMVIAGQGTIALEILRDLPDTEVLMIQLSGGGLLAGMAMAAKSINPKIHVVGLSLERSPAMVESLRAGTPVMVEEKDSIADSLLGGIGRRNRYTLSMVRRYVDEHILISEQAIKDGIFYIFEHHRLIVEGAAAIGIGALLHGKTSVAGKKVALLLSGCGIDSAGYINTLRSRISSSEFKET